MRVALVYPHFNRKSSLARDSVLLARGLVDLGVDVHYYCDSIDQAEHIPGATRHETRGTGHRFHPASRLSYPLHRATFATRATRTLRRARAQYDLVDVRETSAWEHDVVTVHGVALAMQRRWSCEAGRDYRARTARGRAAALLRPQIAVDRILQRLQFRDGRWARVIAASEGIAADLEVVHGIPRRCVDVIPPPIEFGGLEAANGVNLRKVLGLRERDFLLLFIGHAFERKGLGEAIEALAGLQPEAHLVVVGRGDREPFLQSAVRVGVERRVHFVGSTENPGQYFSQADLLVLPTRSEPWGIPLIEAMAAGVPVISTSVAGAASIVQAAQAGLILPSGSPDALRPAIAALLGDPVLRKDMGRRGRHAAARFGVEEHARAVLKTYERVLSERIRARRPRAD